MKPSPWTLIAVGIVLVLAGMKSTGTTQSITDFSQWKATQYDFYYWDHDSSKPLPDYMLGDVKVHPSDISTTCDAHYGIPEPNKNCYAFSLTFNSGPLVTQTFTFQPGDFINATKYLTIEGTASGQVGGSRKTWIESYNLLFAPDAIIAYGIDQKFSQTLSTKTVKFVIQNNLPASFEGGVNILRTDEALFQQTRIDVPLNITKGTNTYQVTINFNKLGVTKLEIQPYIKVYNYALGFTSDNTGLCFCADTNSKGECTSKKCVQKSTIAFSSTPSYRFQTFPTGTDLSKDVTTDCVTTLQCPSKYSCKNNICTYNPSLVKPGTGNIELTRIVDVEEPIAVANAFVGPVNPSIGIAVAGIFAIIVISWIALKWR